MRILDVVRNAHAPTARWAFLPFVVGATGMMLFAGTYIIAFGGPGLARVGAPFDAGLWTAYVLAAAAWWTAFALGVVAAGSGVGLVLALFGLVCRLRGVWGALLIGPWHPDDAAVRSALTMAALHRDLGHFAFGLGLGLVAAASVLDVARRRRDPEWTRVAG